MFGFFFLSDVRKCIAEEEPFSRQIQRDLVTVRESGSLLIKVLRKQAQLSVQLANQENHRVGGAGQNLER